MWHRRKPWRIFPSLCFFFFFFLFQLQISVLDASNLPAMDHGSLDPYCIVSVGHDRSLTEHTHEIRRSQHPMWNTTFKIGPLNIHQKTKKAGFPYNEICFEVGEEGALNILF
jgi:hypothetical protein